MLPAPFMWPPWFLFLSHSRGKAAPPAWCPWLLPLGLAYSARYCNRSPPLHHWDHWCHTCSLVAEMKPEAAGRSGQQGPSRAGASTQQQGRRSGDGGSSFERMPGAGGAQGWKRWQISAPGEGNAQQRRRFGWSQHLFFIAKCPSCHLIPLAAQSSTVEMGLACFFPTCCPTSSEQVKDFHPVGADRAAPSGCETWAHTACVQTVSG